MIASGNGLSPVWHQAIRWSPEAMLLFIQMMVNDTYFQSFMGLNIDSFVKKYQVSVSIKFEVHGLDGQKPPISAISGPPKTQLSLKANQYM